MRFLLKYVVVLVFFYIFFISNEFLIHIHFNSFSVVISFINLSIFDIFQYYSLIIYVFLTHCTKKKLLVNHEINLLKNLCLFHMFCQLHA